MRRRIHFHVFTLLVIVGGIVAIPMPASAIQGIQTTQTINVELILDVSGSMAQVIETGETRMDAAKRVIQEVIGAIPEQEGINVGLRIYGFGGDNADEGRAESCQSSELVAPISGVNKDLLLSEIQALQPTGWTPLALSLERAGEDFQSGENVTNAAVLITDGLETCDGDPCSVASALNASEIQLITHVVGFALVPEEQATLGCIAEGGGGQLLGASNASELSTALFDILEELEVVQGTEFIGGTALGILPEGEVGELSVVEASTLEGRVVGTLSNIYDVELTGPISTNAVCFDEAGTLLNFLQSYSSTESVAPNETLSFQVDNFQTGTCPLFLVAASGWDDTFGTNNSVEPPGASIVTKDQTEAPKSAPTVEGTPASEAPAVQSAPILGDSGCADLASAESILLSLQAAGLPIGDYVVYTSENDPNTLLGRPGQYVAKANFVDTTLGAGSSLFDIAEGGSVEVFETTELAQGRADYITGIIAANPILVEYDFINGPVLLRVSGVLTPNQAAVYDQAVQAITSC